MLDTKRFSQRRDYVLSQDQKVPSGLSVSGLLGGISLAGMYYVLYTMIFTLLNYTRICPIYQVWDHADKFVRGITTVAVSWKKSESFTFPTFVFCDKIGFRDKMGEIMGKVRERSEREGGRERGEGERERRDNREDIVEKSETTDYPIFPSQLLTEHGFLSSTFKVDVNLSGVIVDDFGEKEWPDFVSGDVPTLYNGNCKMFEVKTR